MNSDSSSKYRTVSNFKQNLVSNFITINFELMTFELQTFYSIIELANMFDNIINLSLVSVQSQSQLSKASMHSQSRLPKASM